MINKLKFIFLTAITLLFLNCTSENTPEEIENISNGKFIFEGETYNLTTLWITERQFGNSNPYEINFELFNKENDELEDTDNLLNLTQVVFGIYSNEQLKEESYNTVNNHHFSINDNVVNGNFTEGEVFLTDSSNANENLQVINSDINVNSYNNSEISLEFSFTRKDGKIIVGNYEGVYIKK